MKRSVIMKRGLSFVLLFVLASSVFAFSVYASNEVAYIYKNKVAVDSNVVDLLEGLGLEVDFIDERNIPEDLSGYRFVYVGDERFKNPDGIRIWEYPTVVSNYFYGGGWGLTDTDGVSKL